MCLWSEEELADVQALVIHAVDAHGLTECIRADEAVLGGVFDTRSAVRQGSGHLGAPWDDDDLGLQVKPKLHGPRGDDRAVLRNETDSGACRCRLAQTQDRNAKNDAEESHHKKTSLGYT